MNTSSWCLTPCSALGDDHVFCVCVCVFIFLKYIFKRQDDSWMDADLLNLRIYSFIKKTPD